MKPSKSSKTSFLTLTKMGLAVSILLGGAVVEPSFAADTDWQSKPWKLIWQDEFEGDKVDLSKWSMEVNCWGGGNNERQCYTDQPQNFVFEDGVLHIVAIKGEHTGPQDIEDSPNYDPEKVRTLPFSSGRLRSKNKGDWLYGRFEARAKLPAGQGTWPAFWMLPTDQVYGGWAASGEIDIMEAVNIGTQTDAEGAAPNTPETRVHGTLHYGYAWPENVYSGTGYVLPEKKDPSEGYHTYAVEWEEGEIRWYVDDYHFATQTSADWFSAYKNEQGENKVNPGHSPFDQLYHIVLNHAVGGGWPEATNEKGVDESIYPQRFSIDYVRVYQCSANPKTGKGCATVNPKAKLVTRDAKH